MPDGSVQLLLVGTNHRHAPIGVREELAARAHGDMLVSAVMQEPAVAEAVGLSTCNRCELYMVGDDVGELRAGRRPPPRRLRRRSRRVPGARCST